MNNKKDEALLRALGVLAEAANYTSSESWSPSMTRDCERVINHIKEALAEQPAQQEPVAWMDIDENGTFSGLRYWSEPDNRHEVALYTSPPASKPLPEIVLRQLYCNAANYAAFYKAYRAAHGIKGDA